MIYGIKNPYYGNIAKQPILDMINKLTLSTSVAVITNVESALITSILTTKINVV